MKPSLKVLALLTLCLIQVQGVTGQSENKSNASANDEKQGWSYELGFGIDVLSNLFINPSVGGGTNRLGFGASLNASTIYNAGKFGWKNNLQIDWGVQKTGSGPLNDSTLVKIPFQKNIDNIWFSSSAHLRTSYFSKFYYTSTLFFGSQLTPTYENGYLSSIEENQMPIAKFLSPALLQFAIGMDYRPNDYLSIFASPLSYKTIIVADDNIADDIAFDNLGNVLGTTHGNPFEINDDSTLSVKNYDNQFGALVRMEYNNTLWKKVNIKSNLILFSNYLAQPKNIDVNWRNSIDLFVFKNVSLSLFSVLSYDDDILVQITDNSQPKGVSGLGKRVSYTHQILLKYTFSSK